MVVIGLTELPNSGWAKAHPAHPLAAALECEYKGLVFCRNNGSIMENMDKELTVPKWVLIVLPKIPLNASKNISPKV